ncbi:mitochondrial ribosomal small subunit component [Xylographa opegraphella]|nr:mitochondrial ribosomal small subunit component [Xylographa opegraphella]
MGRYNFRPQRVYQATTQLLSTGRLTAPPSWYNIVGNVPPPQILVRTQPIEHHRRSRTKKPSKLFQPQNITYPEDKLRREFFGDHPWELARPRVVLENDGKDAQTEDWSQIRQPGRPLDGESVVRRQAWLMENVPKISKAGAYDQARREFYEERLQEDVERRVAKEEALATGAYFGKSMLEVGMELEDREYERWREWASKEVTEAKQRQAAMYTGVDNSSMTISADDPETIAGMEDFEEDSIPAQGQESLGGMPVKP